MIQVLTKDKLRLLEKYSSYMMIYVHWLCLWLMMLSLMLLIYVLFWLMPMLMFMLAIIFSTLYSCTNAYSCLHFLFKCRGAINSHHVLSILVEQGLKILWVLIAFNDLTIIFLCLFILCFELLYELCPKDNHVLDGLRQV